MNPTYTYGEHGEVVYPHVFLGEELGPGSWQANTARLDEQRRTRIAIERVAEAAESIARSLNRAWYAEHPIGGGDQ